MTPQEITASLIERFVEVVEIHAPDSWQVEIQGLRLLVLLSEELSWLRALVTIAPAPEALPFAQQLLEANFDETLETRYAFFQNVLWGVFQHNFLTLTVEDFQQAIERLIDLQQRGLTNSFSQFAETQIRQIIYAAKQQGQSLETTLQNLDRLYEEGVMGDINQSAAQRNEVLNAWRYQLGRLWEEV
ncbi:MAG TPA: hypothetical protein V6C65_28900 [Allocoleopsis sp.]